MFSFERNPDLSDRRGNAGSSQNYYDPDIASRHAVQTFREAMRENSVNRDAAIIREKAIFVATDLPRTKHSEVLSQATIGV